MILSTIRKNKLDIEKVCWRITRKCNLRCPFCLAGYRNRFYEDMSLAKVLEALNILVSAGTKAISFSGGEPLLREDFDVILRASSDKGIKNTVTTNGTLITPYWVSVLRNYTSKVKVSLDGTRNVHNKLRDSETFDLTFTAVQNLLENNIEVDINYIITSQNISCIKNFCKLFEELPVSRINFIIPMNKENMKEAVDLFVTENQLRLVRKTIDNINKTSKLDLVVKSYFGDVYRRPLIETDGTILKCMSYSEDDILIGNIFDIENDVLAQQLVPCGEFQLV